MKIVAIGDSITYGYPFGKQDSWVEHLVQALKCQVLNQGINGDLTKGMRKRFERDVLANTPTHVIILGGANDAFKKLKLDKVSENFIAMVEMCRQSGITPIFGLPTPSLLPEQEQLLNEYRNWLKDYANKQGITVIDFNGVFQERLNSGQGKPLFHDGIHPSIEGYNLMGIYAVQTLKDL